MGIMDLAASVLDYYFTRADELSEEKRFHLANRMTAWNGDARAKGLLDACRQWFVPNPVHDDSLYASFEKTSERAGQSEHHMVGYGVRKPYLEKHSKLLVLEAELFRLRHLRTIFGVDATNIFLRRHSLSSLVEVEQNLLADPAGMRILSTWAINYLYLLHRIVLEEDTGIDVLAIYNLADDYDLNDEEQVRFFIYLYTHCIIAESNFYARPLPATHLTEYRRMLVRLEELLSSRLQQTSLDTKLEFLVCCRLVGYETNLTARIHDECAASVSPEGTFIIDTHNVFAENQHKKTFNASEHRNVLFVMSVLPRL